MPCEKTKVKDINEFTKENGMREHRGGEGMPYGEEGFFIGLVEIEWRAGPTIAVAGEGEKPEKREGV